MVKVSLLWSIVPQARMRTLCIISIYSSANGIQSLAIAFKRFVQGLVGKPIYLRVPVYCYISYLLNPESFHPFSKLSPEFYSNCYLLRGVAGFRLNGHQAKVNIAYKPIMLLIQTVLF